MLVIAYGFTGAGPAAAQSHSALLESVTRHATGVAPHERVGRRRSPGNSHEVSEEVPGLSLALSSVQPSLRSVRAVAASETEESRAIILVYHHVDSTTPPSTSITPKKFASHLDLLASTGYRVIGLADVVDALRSRTSLPDRAVVLTFDDAYRSVYTEAFPRLRRRSWPFTVFVYTDAVDWRHANTMSWSQLRAIEDGGGTVGNHSRTHDHLVRRRGGETRDQWRRRVSADILWAQRRLEEEVVAPLDVFAYPYGESSEDLEVLVRALGFAAVGQQSGPVGPATGIERIPRFPVATGYDDLRSLAEKLETRAFRVEVVAPRSRVLRTYGDAPALTLRIFNGDFALDSLACFATGQGRVGYVWLDRQRREVRVQAAKPLPAGRSKYTCTAPAAGRPGAYFWYSHPWLQPRADGSWPDG